MAIVNIIYRDGYKGSIDAEIVRIEHRAELLVILKVNFLNEILKLLCFCCFLSSVFFSFLNCFAF